ncbi:MAG: HesA/MoeB/ThiF family protein, partial [Pseudomonadota bacterium]|nr:HesA/MoeB/ThiF family protein [Pseudomonadota bacterium]
PAILGLSEITAHHDVYDLRDETEAPIPAHPKAQRLLPDALPRFHPTPGRQAVFACTSGLRAWRAVRALPEVDQPGVAILAAGPA